MQHELFSILDTVESTNNYAIEKIKQGFGLNGKAYFAKEQWGGKGQRGKNWISEAGKNIILSVMLKPNMLFSENPFYFSALVASTAQFFIANLISTKVKIKWPNDLYINDRKAGGILIENLYTGNNWEWAIVGIGININQVEFDAENNKTSVLNESNILYDPLSLALRLHQNLLLTFADIKKENYKNGLLLLNEHLYKKNETIYFNKNSEALISTIIEVNNLGQLVTEQNGHELIFNVGDVVFNTPKSFS